ncbi:MULTISPECIES: FeoA family protein [Nostoc]|uniref:Ferrous iron transport protein A n=1 Tax=Nostoc paludosum FACHB-159 TaxID=2692908 RepID=A0ABR8KEB7_9NOSO|nr:MULTISPECIES: FeoA domain-containing protein [Nostoc]MBD2681442.1 ferrous iron transport protein A [Nostoc sp. FACHB-857]MBD2737900.1 ferrous iron transport protein A [Nostoc paludosum FACHB-159]
MFTPFRVIGCSLELLGVGEQGIISFCKIEDETILNKLISKGIIPGKSIIVQQRFPSLIIKVENTSLSVDIETARAIYIRIIHH